MTAAQRWARDLGQWAIPEEILAQAPEDPWQIPPQLFAPESPATETASHRRALEALPDGGIVLDVGAGGGAMSRPLRRRAGRIVVVDSSAAMLEQCDHAQTRIHGVWPDVAGATGVADVAVCGHVVYNVADIVPFLAALAAGARRRVVLEMTDTHPLDNPVEAELWRSVWGIERPHGPNARDLLAVLNELGIDAFAQRWEREQRESHDHLEARVTLVRRHLCLPVEREDEVRAALRGAHPWLRHIVTVWWDTSAVVA